MYFFATTQVLMQNVFTKHVVDTFARVAPLRPRKNNTKKTKMAAEFQDGGPKFGDFWGCS